MKKILLKGYYGFGNLGDDILMKVSCKILKSKYPNANIFIYSENTFNNPNFKCVKDYNSYIHNLLGERYPIIDWTYKEKFDLVFNGGGGLYNDYRDGKILASVANKTTYLFTPQQLYNLEHLLRGFTRKKSNLNYNFRIGFGLGIGPYTPSAPSYVRALAEIGSYDVLFVRDNKSIDFLKKINFKSPFYKATDIAFLTQYWLSGKCYNKNLRGEIYNIGVILRDEKNEKYFSNLKQAILHLESKGFKVNLISFHELEDKKFIEFFSGKVKVWQPNKLTLNEFLTLLNEQHLLITSRAHGAILGACMGIPSICLGISQKLKEVANMLPQSSCLLLPPFDTDDVVNAVNNIVEGYFNVKRKLESDISHNNKIAEEGLMKLIDTLDQSLL